MHKSFAMRSTMLVSRSLHPRSLVTLRYASRSDNMPFKESKVTSETSSSAQGDRSSTRQGDRSSTMQGDRDTFRKSTPQSQTSSEANEGWESAAQHAKGEGLYGGVNVGIDTAHTQSGSSLRSDSATNREAAAPRSSEENSRGWKSKLWGTGNQDANRNNLQTQRKYSTLSKLRALMTSRFISQAGMDKTEEAAAGSDRNWDDSNKKRDSRKSSNSDQQESSFGFNKEPPKTQSETGQGVASADRSSEDLAEGKMATSPVSDKGFGTSESRRKEGSSNQKDNLSGLDLNDQGIKDEDRQDNEFDKNKRGEENASLLVMNTKNKRLS
jgi:hypothetical protein